MEPTESQPAVGDGAVSRREPTSDVSTPSRLDLRDPSLYINRELSLLQFNRRVLAQAENPATPLLERLRFLTICSTNLDEVFEIRVGSLQQQVELGIGGGEPDGCSAAETLRRVHEVAHVLVDDQYRVLTEEIIPELESEGVRLIFRRRWNDAIRDWSRSYFAEQVFPVLTPLGLDPAHPFPAVLNKSLNFVVSLAGKDAFGRSGGVAVVQAPRPLPRLIRLPTSVGGTPESFVTLSGIIHENVGHLFPGMKVRGCYPFRLTRNSNLWVDEEEADDLLRALQGELPRRNYGQAVRIEVNESCPPEMRRYLLEKFDLEPQALYEVAGPVNIYRVAILYDMVDRPDLKFRPFTPGLPKGVVSTDDMFEVLRKRDVLLHHPFQSFGPVLDLLKQAAHDPDVLAIKVTLYRTGEASPLTDALLDAALGGKEVTAVVELRARFDEAENIDIATRLKEAGAKVVYGVVGYKAHAKMILIVKREGGALRRYVHLGTGNYHIKNTRAYTDFGLMTCDDQLGEDVHDVFQQLTGLGKVGRLHKMLQSPFTLHASILDHIRAETEAARAGRPAAIRAKMNALVEPRVMRALYEASRAGVSIDLVVRGICCLRPGIPGVSENIRVRSIVGRFLEHSRVFNFHADGEETTWCSSADWMPRNFFRRVETAFPVRGKLRRRIIEEGLDPYLRDDVQAWELQPDGTYVQVGCGDDEGFSAQLRLLELLSG